MMSYNEVIKDLEARVIMPDRAPSLVPVKEGLLALGLKYDPARVIIVAGTNGKGTVSATLSALISSTGEKVGLYTSPHLANTTERLQINGQPISIEDFVKIFRIVKDKTSSKKLSHFEMLTLMAHVYFYEEKCDWMIYEVGLGGVWDATNAIDHSTSVITRIGYDHQDILGYSLWEIAKNKLGIVRDNPDHKVIHWSFPEEIKTLFNGYKNQIRASFFEVTPPDFYVEKHGVEPKYKINSKWGSAELSLVGRRAVENTAIALEVFYRLGFSVNKHLESLNHVYWPGRMEKVQVSGRSVFLSGDHNVQGVESLKELLADYSYENIYAVVGIGKSKDFSAMLKTFTTIRNLKLILTETPFRGLKLEEYGAWLQNCEYSSNNPSDALRFALASSTQKDLVLVTGSLYLVGLFK